MATGLADLNSTIQNSSFDGIISGQIRVGGLVGRNTNSQVLRSFSKGVVKAEEYEVGGIVGSNNSNKSQVLIVLEANVSGSFRVGGLAGLNAHGGLITRSYSIGPSQMSVLSLVGAEDSTSSSSFWDMFFRYLNECGRNGCGGQNNCRDDGSIDFPECGLGLQCQRGNMEDDCRADLPTTSVGEHTHHSPYDLNNTLPYRSWKTNRWAQ